MDILAGLPPYTLYIVIGIFLLINLGIGLYQGQHLDSLRSYALANQQMGTGTLAITLIATVMEGGYLSAGITSAQQTGKGIFSHTALIAIMPISILLVSSYLFPKLVGLQECYTLGDIMGKLYGRAAQIFTGLFSIATSLFLLAAQFIAVSSICQALHIDPFRVIVAMGIVVTFYTLLGGMRSVAATDVFQFVCLILGLLFIVYRIFQLDDGTGQPVGSIQNLVSNLHQNYRDTHFRIGDHPRFWGIIFNIICGSTLILFSAPVINRLLVARNAVQMKKSFYGFVVFYTLIVVLLTLIGLGLLLKHGSGKINSNISFLVVAESFFQSSPWAVVLLLVMFLAVVMSTADSFLNSLVVVVLQDLIKPFQQKKKDLSLKNLIPLITIITGSAATLIALFLKGALVATVISLASRSLGIFLVPVLLYALGLKLDSRVFWSSMAGFFMGAIILGGLVQMNYIYLDDLETWKTLKFRRKTGLVVSIAILCALVVSLAVHYLLHGGFVFEPREEKKKKSFKEPSNEVKFSQEPLKWTTDKLASLKESSVYKFFQNLLPWATDKIATEGSAPVLTGMFLSFSWMLPELTAPQPHPANLNVLFWVRGVGLFLCTGLMLHNQWQKPFKRYFPLYYYMALGYGLPFSYTLSFLYNPNNQVNLLLLIISLIILMILVDQNMFFSLLGAGSALAWTVARFSPVQEKMLGTTIWHASVGVGYALIAGLVFMQCKEQVMASYLRSSKIWSLGYNHDIGPAHTILQVYTRSIDELLRKKRKKSAQEGKTYYEFSRSEEEELQKNIDILKDAGGIVQDLPRAFDALIKKGTLKQEDLERGSILTFARKGLVFVPKSYQEQSKVVWHEDQDFEATVHPIFFGNIIANLIKNASHAHATRIEIGCTDDHNLYVKDNGRGIPPDVAPRIFDLYFSTGGKGIGLPFVRQLLEGMGGKIRLETSPQGTTFFISFS